MISYGATDGEQLCALLRYKLVGEASWSTLAYELRFTSHEDSWSKCFQQILAVNAAGRIVAGGGSLAGDHNLDDPQFDHTFREFLQGTFAIARSQFEEVFRQGKRAVKASRSQTSPRLAEQIKTWAERHHPHCYICGQTLNFVLKAPEYRDYTADHIWPRAYGGNSEKENILPACRECNSKKKSGFATWAMTSFQSVSLGLKPSGETLSSRVSGEHRFALHYKAVQTVAEKGQMTLKEAFLSIGPWATLRVIDPTDVGHFFNLRIHNEA